MKTLLSFLTLSFALAACAVAPDDEIVEETSDALISNGGSTGLTAGECTSCGCTLQQTSGPDGNGCRTYRCVCDSEAKARCATGKKVAAMSAVSRP